MVKFGCELYALPQLVRSPAAATANESLSLFVESPFLESFFFSASKDFFLSLSFSDFSFSFCFSLSLLLLLRLRPLKVVIMLGIRLVLWLGLSPVPVLLLLFVLLLLDGLFDADVVDDENDLRVTLACVGVVGDARDEDDPFEVVAARTLLFPPDDVDDITLSVGERSEE